MTFENRLAIADKGFFKPRDHVFPFRFGVAGLYVIVRQSDIERILPREEAHRHKFLTQVEIRIVVTTVVNRPIRIPRTGVIGDGIVGVIQVFLILVGNVLVGN